MSALAKQLILDLGHRTASGREDFLVSPANEDAVAWVDSWPDWPAPALVLYGPPSCGKSHLAAVWADRTKAAMISPDMVLKKDANIIADEAKYLVVEKIDNIIGNKKGETALFHLYNLIREEQRTILLTAQKPPIRARFTIMDLASRLRAAPSTAIHPPDDTLLAAILVKLFSDRQLHISADVLNYILPRIERSFAAANHLIDEADKLALAEKRPISIPLIRQILQGYCKF